jgi:hypothetical protein
VNRAAVFLAIGVLLAATEAAAATPQDLCKGGELINVRTSKLKPGRSNEGFVKAVHDHQAWYRAHGLTQNDQIAGVVLVYDQAAKSSTASPDTVATVHVNPPGPTGPAHDSAWDAFVSEYRANSDLATETMICLERPIR